MFDRTGKLVVVDAMQICPPAFQVTRLLNRTDWLGAMRISPTFQAHIDFMSEAWANPEHIVNGWGPNGFTITIHEMDSQKRWGIEIDKNKPGAGKLFYTCGVKYKSQVLYSFDVLSRGTD